MEMLGDRGGVRWRGMGKLETRAQQVICKCLARVRNLPSALRALDAFRGGAREFAACFHASMERGKCAEV